MNPVTNRFCINRLFNFVISKSNWRHLHTSPKWADLHEVDEKHGFPHISDYKPEKTNVFQKIYKGYGHLIEECKALKEEIKNNMNADPTMMIYPGEVDIQFSFNGDPKTLDKWVVTCDSDYSHGFSKATLSLSPTGCGVFSGTVDTTVPKDGLLHRAGYCNVKSVLRRGPFKVEKPFQWLSYTHLILRIRGDGHSYMLNLHLKNDFDITWADIHCFPLYTRGGPYWQYVKIPFSKFYLANRGRVQDSQFPVRRWEVRGVSITAAGITGPFKLEIDYIGVQRDLKHSEEFAYEMYKPPNPYYI